MSYDPFPTTGSPVGGPPLRPPPRRPDPVTLVWIGGIVLAALAYAMGPAHFLGTVLTAISHVGWYVNELVRDLTATAFDVVRAAAIGLYGVFAALSIIAIGRGGRGRVALVVVTAVFLLLVWGAWDDAPGINARWTGALLLTAASALSVTRRLTQGAR
jgi:hypothetical protein